MRRPEPARDDEQVGREALAKRGLQLFGLVSDERDSRGLEAEPRQLVGEKRAVRVAAPAAHELAAGDDDGRAGSQPTGGASETRFGVTSSHRRAPVPAPARPVVSRSAKAQIRGREDVEPETLPDEGPRVPFLERPLVDRLLSREPRKTWT